MLLGAGGAATMADVPRLLTLTAVVATLAVAAGCSGGSEKPQVNKPFCDAAGKYEDEIERQANENDVDIDKQIELVRDLVEHAPKPIKPQAETFLDAMERVQDEPEIRDQPEVREAVEDVNRYAAQGCNVYERRGL